jgi:hypothetical protein
MRLARCTVEEFGSKPKDVRMREARVTRHAHLILYEPPVTKQWQLRRVGKYLDSSLAPVDPRLRARPLDYSGAVVDEVVRVDVKEGQLVEIAHGFCGSPFWLTGTEIAGNFGSMTPGRHLAHLMVRPLLEVTMLAWSAADQAPVTQLIAVPLASGNSSKLIAETL